MLMTRNHAIRWRTALAALLVVPLLLLTRAAGSAPAANTYVVNSTLTTADPNIGDGICGGNGICTLFAAIQEANHDSAHDTIAFNIPGAGPHAFVVTSADNQGLPAITRPVTIDGSTQPGAACPNVLAPADLRIALDGRVGQAYGLRLESGADGSVIKGLAIGNFGTAGILIRDADDVHIACNHIGLAPDGNTPLPNGNGIRIVDQPAGNTTIGGTTSLARSERNVISGNQTDGIFDNNLNSGTRISGNFIGTNAAGSVAVPNGHGILLRSDNATIGGLNSWEANVISGNRNDGVRIGVLAENVTVINNLIGTDPLGIGALGNGNNGIAVTPNDTGGGPPTNVIIGLLAPNTIAHNGQNGVVIPADTNGGGEVSGVTIVGNRIDNNGQIGIDLANDGVTLNDSGDTDGGPNGRQNYPVLTVAHTGGRIAGTFQGQTGPAQTYRLDVYQSSACDPSGYGEGATWLTTFDVASSGNVVFIDRFITPRPPVGSYLTMIATDAAGNSSEFGNCRLVEPTPLVVNDAAPGIYANDTTPGDGLCQTARPNGSFCSLQAALQEANALGGGPHRITFDLSEPALISIGDSAPLPPITAQVQIDGRDGSTTGACPTGAAGAATLPVTLSGVSSGAGANGLLLAAGSDGSTIHAIAVVGFSGSGIVLNSHANRVTCSAVGRGGIVAWHAANGIGITIAGDNNVIGGLDPADRNIISANSGDGVRLTATAGGNTLVGNFIGLSETGALAAGNGGAGVWLDGADGNAIGGSTTAHPFNVISANSGDGVRLTNAAHNNTIERNIIGLAENGATARGNGGSGVRAEDSDGTRIGLNLDVANVISANGEHGVWIDSGDDSTIAGNTIGLTQARTAAVGNGLSGVRLDDGSDNTIGGSSAAVGNTIAGNARNGVYLAGAPFATTIRHNSFGRLLTLAAAANGFHGIHIDGAASQTAIHDNVIAHSGRDGVRIDALAALTDIARTPFFDNQWLGIDRGENGVGNPAAPVTLIGHDVDAQKLFAAFSGAAANTTYRIDLFRSVVCDSSGFGEGQFYLGSETVQSGAGGNAEFALGGSFAYGDILTLTATRTTPGNDTSEFSACYNVTVPTAVNLRQSSTAAPVLRVVLATIAFILLLTAVSARRCWAR